MIKKLFKRGLSLLLALVLVATTFFIFDPDLLKIDADAYVDVETAEAGAYLSEQTFYATETIYLKSGANDFQHYENFDYYTGSVTSPVDAIGKVYFRNNDVTEVSLYVNNAYKRDANRTQVPVGKLKINSVTVSEYAEMANGTASRTKGTQIATVKSGTLDYPISAGSLSGWTEGGVYIIEWVVAYKTKHTGDTMHYAFAYTGIYATPNDQAGVTLAARHQNDDATSHQYNFITGGHKVSGGNAYSAITDTSGNTKLDPLHGFVGQMNSSTGYTVVGGTDLFKLDSSYFPEKTGGGVAAQTFDETSCGGADTGWGTVEVSTVHRTEASDGDITVGSYDSPNAQGKLRRGFSDNHTTVENHMTGVAYLLVDTSRYSNYKDIPNFRVGWLQLYAKSADRQNNVTNIYVATEAGTASADGYSVLGVDTGNFDNSNTNSCTRGLYTINGAISNGLKFVNFESRVTRDRGVSDHRMFVYSNVGFHTTTWNQADLREGYNSALCTYVDYQNLQKFASGQAGNYVEYYYNNLRSAGERLADPTDHYEESTLQNLKTYTETCKKAIREGSAPSIYFYVPETIYTNPIASNGKYNFSYYVDRISADGGSLSTSGTDASGDVYLNGSTLDHVISVTGSVATTSNDGGNGVVKLDKTSTNLGSLVATIENKESYTTTYADYTIKWEAVYVTKTGETMTIYAWSYVHALPLWQTNQSSVISSSAHAGYNSGTHTDTNQGVTGWIVGAYKVTARSYHINSASTGTIDNGSVGDGRGGYKNNYIENSGYVPTNGNDNISDLYNESYNGGSGYYAKDGDVNWSDGGAGEIYIDSSRCENLAAIPYLYAGFDCNNHDSKTINAVLYGGWYSETSSKNPTTYSLASDTGFDTGERHLANLSEVPITRGTSTTDTFVLHAWTKNSAHTNRTAQASCYLICHFRDKRKLREAYNSALNKNIYLQQAYFKDAEWSAFTTAFDYTALYLCDPENATTQADMDAQAKTLTNQINKLVGAITAAEETYTYELADGSPATAKRSDVLNQGTANVYHVLADIDESGELKGVSYIYADGTLHSKAPETAADGLETKPYFYGDTVVTGYNDYEGYNYYGYYLSTSGAKWADDPSLETVTGDVAAQGTYGSTGHNRYTLAKSPNITYTYIYSKDPSGVYMDWGESEQSFMNKQNLVNLKNVNVNTAFTGDDTYYNALSTEVAIVDTTDTDAFSFTVRSPGYNLMTPKSEGLKDYFDFSKMVWGGDAANNKAISGDTMILDNENETVTLRVDNQKTDKEGNPFYDGYVGLYETNGAMWMTLVPGKKYRLSYNYKNNNYSQVPNVTLAPYAFFSNDQNSWAGCANHYDPFTEEEGEDILEFTVPTGYKYVSLRFGCTTQNADITFSDIHVVEISDANRFAKMTDLFFENAATGLEGGKTYTVSFKSSLRYDDYRWYAMNMYGEASPEMDWAHEQGTIQMFISTTSNGDKLYNYTVPVRITTGVSGGGTIGTFELPEGCTNINLGFCITNDTAIGGWVDDIRIVEGDYVEVGAVGETYNLPTPLREGYSFKNWSEKSTPFHGILGTGNPYTYGTSSDTVLAHWVINHYDVTFDNEFRFDEYVWNGSGREKIDVDTETNTVTIFDSTSKSDGTYDSYAGAYTSAQTGRMVLTPGHTYRFSFKLKNLDYSSNSSVTIQPYVFASADGSTYSGVISPKVTYTTETGTFPKTGSESTGVFKVPAGKPYVAIRLGTRTAQDVEFSDIYIQDITRGFAVKDNEFEFTAESYNDGNGTVVSDTVNKTYTITTTGETSDHTFTIRDIMDIVPGHTYTVSYDYSTIYDADKKYRLQNHFFFYANETDANNNVWSNIGFPTYGSCPGYIQGNTYTLITSGTTTGTIVLKFKVPDNAEFARLRLGNSADPGGTSQGMSTTFSNIVVKDTTTGIGLVDDTTVSEPQYNGSNIHGVVREYQELLVSNATGSDLTTMPTMTSDAYFFKGWYTEKTGGTQVTDTSGYKTHAGTNQLWSQWQVHIEYDLSRQGGAYLDPEQAPKTSKKFDVGTIVNATIDDYVPYKVGYNFKGWKDKFMHNTYQPGQTVEVLGYSLILEPIWEAATDVSKDQDYEQITTLHPGQVYFYAYTPTTNNEYVSGYVYGTDSNLSVSLYNGNTVTTGTKYDAATTVYGVNGVKTIVSGALTKGTEYYFGVTSASGTKTEVSGEKFKVSEHVVKYTLNGGEGTPATQTVYGHYNTDLVFEEPTRTGHNFANWSTAPDQDSGSKITQSFTNGMITSSTGFVTEKTMYAAWSANSYALGLYAYYNEATGSTTTSSHEKATKDKNGGLIKISGDAEFATEITTSIVYNQPVTVEAEPATGYSFKGWYANPTFSGETITAWGDVMYSDAKSIIEHMPANTLNLYARFDINTYVVNLYAYSNSGTNPEEYELSSLGGTVYFDNGTGAISATQRYVHGQSYTMHAVPATGYAFEGWYYGDTPLTGGAASGKEDQKIDLVKDAYSDHACDHSYKAKFSVQKAKLTVSGNGGSPAEQEFEGYMGSTVNVTQPTRDGYTFDGWTLVDNKTQGKPNGTITVDGVYTFGADSDNATANWKVINYPITVDPAGGTATVEYKTGDVISNFTQTITQSTKFSVAYDSTVALRAPSKTGHTFDKWVKSDTATGGDLVVTSNGTEYKVGLNDAAVITATWTVNTYPLIVSAWSDSAGLEGKYSEGGNGGTVKFGEVTSQKIEDVVNYGSRATIYAIPAAGYTFLGWQTVEPSTKEELELIPDAPAEFVTAPMGTQGLHYYAVFGINQYTVDLKTAYNTPDAYDTFVEGTDGGTVTGSGKYSHNQTATLTATPKTGYAFKGWYDGETEVSVNPTYTVTVNKDIALTAKFTVVEYTIITTAVSNYANNQDQFNGNPNAGYFKDQNHNFKYYYGQETEIEAIAKPGYEFKGWFSDFALTHEIGDKTSVLKVSVTENTTYYAKFEVIKVAVNLFAMSNSGSNLKDYAQNAVGGKVSYDNVTYDATAKGESYFGGNYTIYAKAETGYTFDGWYTNAELTGEPFTGSYSNGYYSYIGTADNADGVNLYAKFSVGAYDLNVFAYSNTGIGLTTYNNNNVGGTVDVVGDFIAGDKVADSTNAHVTAKVYFDKVATVIATPKKGYTFGGWYTTTASDVKPDFKAEPAFNDASITTAAMGVNGLNYYAKFEVGSFNIVYNVNGGSDLTTDTGTAYYNTAFNITQETPTKVGHIFLGWSVGNAAATAPDYKAGLTLIDAATISQWYTETYNGSAVTLYAVWAVSANYIIAKAAYSPANGEYKIGTTGGTIEVIGEKDETGNVVVQAGTYVKNHLNIIPATGYSLVCWKYKYIDDGFVDGSQININTWGGDNVGTDFTTMPSQILYVVAFFEIRTFSAEAKAYYNTAAETDVYNYGATGGTVKRGTNGKSASNAVSENMAYGGKVLFVADPARGYLFKGWYGEPTFVNETVTDWGTPVTTDTENYVEIKDTSAEGKETANNYYAVFTINFHKATASVRTYTVREELIYSLTEDKRPGGDPSSKGGVVGISTKPITEDEALSGAWKDDSDWLKTGVYANEIYPYINEIYYGQRVYFAAIANPGYVFGGWYDKQDAEYYGENLVEEENLAYSRIMREGDIYMEAKFVPVSFTLVLDANEGVQGNPTEIIVTYGASFIIDPLSAPTKTGSTFKGWADAPDWTGAEAEEAPYQVKDTILPSTVNAWFNEIYDSQTGTVSTKTIYAVWETAYITINLDRQGATGGKNSTEITLGSSLKSLEKDELPVYEGFVFGGYWSEAGGKGTQYYRANGEATSAVWNTPSNGTIYALWTCPVLESIDYEDGKWC